MRCLEAICLFDKGPLFGHKILDKKIWIKKLDKSISNDSVSDFYL